jgi:hypothetical protein
MFSVTIGHKEQRMISNEKGFSAAEGILLLAVATLVGVMGWVLWQRHDTKQTVNINQVAVTDCFTANGEKANWKTVESSVVTLSDWKVTLTLPRSSIGKAVCKSNGDGYEFSTKAVINDAQCVAHYQSSELSDPGVSVSRYSQNMAAEGQVSGATGTLEDYYKTHKAMSGNYFTVPGSGRNYYKFGSYFYVAFGDATGIYEKYKSAREAACKNESPNFMQVFVDAMPTLKQM